MPNAAVHPVNNDLPELDESMTRADLVEALSHLPFRGGVSTTIKLDRGVSAYLIRLLQQSARN